MKLGVSDNRLHLELGRERCPGVLPVRSVPHTCTYVQPGSGSSAVLHFDWVCDLTHTGVCRDDRRPLVPRRTSCFLPQLFVTHWVFGLLRPHFGRVSDMPTLPPLPLAPSPSHHHPHLLSPFLPLQAMTIFLLAPAKSSAI